MAILGRAKHIPQQTTRPMFFKKMRKLGLAWTEIWFTGSRIPRRQKVRCQIQTIESCHKDGLKTIYWGMSHVVFVSFFEAKELGTGLSSSYPHGRKKQKMPGLLFSWHLSQSFDLVPLLLIRSVARSSGLHKMILGSVELMRTCAEAKL
jgi:hypothetical protein